MEAVSCQSCVLVEGRDAIPEEYDEGLGNLAKAGRKVDFIVSHCAPAHVQDI